MVRKTICYIISLTYFVLLILFIKCILDYNFFENNFLYILLIFAIIFLCSIPSVQLFGLPNNDYKEYILKYISYKEIIDFKGKNIDVLYQNKIWYINYKGKKYIFDMRGWINQKQRVIDFLFIQFHNNYYNCKQNKLIDYAKNNFKKEKIKIEFTIKNKKKLIKFKPSIILRIKMIIAIQRNPRTIDKSLAHVKRDLFLTYFILH